MVTITGAVVIDAGMARVDWSSDRTPPLSMRCFVAGRLWAQWTAGGASGSIQVPAPVGEYPFFEILDHASELPRPGFPGRVLLHWPAVSGAARYRIDESVASVWTARGEFAADGRQYYGWLTRWLEDAASHQFRIVSLDAAGNSTVSATMSVEMRRHPDLPQVSVSVNADGTITIQ